VTSSGSGLDPHISPENALAQAGRIAAARGVDVVEVQAAIEQGTEAPFLGIYGQPRVNVLRVNLALDVAFPAP
jgi:potassium-transporting ATPase KdpC subunit